MAGLRTSIYISPEMNKKLELNKDKGRGASLAINSVVDRYYLLVTSEKKKLEALFSEGEWNVMRNACASAVWHPANVIRKGVLAKIEGSLDGELEMYGANRKELEDKLNKLNPGQEFALVELIESWWRRQ